MSGANKEKESAQKLEQYAKSFDENFAFSLLKKLRKETKDESSWLSKPAEKVVTVLGHCLSAYQNPRTPMGVKASIVAVVGYILCPIDLIPDVIPAVGWTDDLSVAASLVVGIMIYSDFSLEELDRIIRDEESCKNVKNAFVKNPNSWKRRKVIGCLILVVISLIFIFWYIK